MTRKLIFTSIVAVAALSLAAGAAGAQDREGNARRRESGRATQQGTAQRRQAPPQAESRASEPRRQTAAQAVPRGSENRSYAARQAAPRESGNRTYSAPQADTRGGGSAQASAERTMTRGYGRGQAEQRAVPRSGGSYGSQAYRPDDHRGYAQPGGSYGRYSGHGYMVPRDFHPYRPLYFSRPYYGFRPHVHLGFGIWLGVAVPYPWAYFGAYVPRVYGYYNQGFYAVTPGMPRYGGLSFDIQPYDAGLFVDGEYVGTVGTFTPYGEPLTLWPGVHHIAIVSDGFRTMEWEVTVEPGRVIPYRGMLARW
jgi:hypothetical protein